MPSARSLLSSSAFPPVSAASVNSVSWLPCWLDCCERCELPVIHFHDLRHTGNTLAASTGAGLRELMDRMGHSTARAAMIYLHATDERQQAIADALSKLAEGGRGRSWPSRSGTQRAQKRRNAS